MNLSPLRRIRLFLLPSLLLAATMSAAPDADPLAPGEKAASEWIKVRLETTRIEGTWAADRPLLESTVNGLKERAQGLEEKRDLLKAKTAKDRDDSETMEAKNKVAAEDLHAVDARLQLRHDLPPRLSEALDMSYRSLGNPSLASGERMQLAMTVLNRCAVFNRTVTSGEEVLTIDGEPNAKSLNVIYWGLSHAYALDRLAGKAWYGSPGPRGWQWEARPDSVQPVTRLIAIYNDKADPDFVSVPATLGQTLADGANK
jgi:hypothetical protein